jgi:hypothetical protein
VLEEPDLTPVERALCEVAAAGRLLDRHIRRPGEDDPAHGGAWGKDRQIRAQLLFQLLTGQGCLDQAFGPPLAVRLRGTQISGRLNLGGLTLRCPLELYSCFMGGRLDLAKVTAPDISLRGTYLCQRLSARRLRLDHNLNLQGFHCHGPINLLGAHIGGQLNCEQAMFANPNGTALSADGMVVAGDLFLSSAQVSGEVRLLGARIGGQLACEQATFSNSNGPALSADEIVVDGGLFLRSSEVTGEVRLLGARIGSQFACEQSTLTNSNGRVLSADGMVVDGDLFLRSSEVTGEVRLVGARIGGQFACEQATFTNPNGSALNLERASVTQDVIMRPARLEGSINLTAAQVGGWYDDKQTWPTALSLDGFVYDAINAQGVTPQVRLDWLRRHQGDYVPQPYEQLAAVYRRAGDHEGARTVDIAKQQVRRAKVKGWARWPSRAWSGFLRWTIGYGYRPGLVIPYLIALFAVGWLVFDYAYPADLRPAKSGSEQPEFHPARYTLDLLLPVANLKHRDAFVPHGYVGWWAFGLSLAGWLLAAVVVAGLTGVFKRD